jgi:hypothetical protein
MAMRKDEDLYNLVPVTETPPHCAAELKALLEEAHSLKLAVARLDEIKTRVKELVYDNGICNEAGHFGVRSGSFCVMVVERSGRKTLDREALIDNGVSPMQIEASMKQGKPSVSCELHELGQRGW